MTTHADRRKSRIPALAALAALLAGLLVLSDRTPPPKSALRLKPRLAAKIRLQPEAAAPALAAATRPAAEEAPLRETEPETLGTFADPFPRAVPVQSVDSPPDAEGRVHRLRVVRAAAKFPFIRYEETLVDDPEHGRVIVERRIMAADHIMVQLKKGVNRAALETLAAKHGCRILRSMRHPGGFVVGLPSHDVAAVPGAIDRFRVEAASISIAEPDFVRTVTQAQEFPSDPRFPSQWNLHNTGQVIVPFNPQTYFPEHWTGGPWPPFTAVAGKDIDAPEGWDYQVGANEYVIAVIDTGVDQTHPDLERWKFRHLHELDPDDGIDDDGNGYIDDFRGWDFVDADNDPAPAALDGHGTHVAGIAAAEGTRFDGPNPTGIAGVNWFGVVMSLRAGSTAGGFFDQDIVDAIDYATENNAYVANCSFGGPGFHAMTSAAIDRALNRPVEKGGPMLMACAAGNEFQDADLTPFYPASYGQQNIISVMATDFTDARPAFSNWGLVSVHLAAPGDPILSTVPGGGYEWASGTSMAAPHIAGAVGIVARNNGLLKPLEVRQCIINGVDSVPALAGLCQTGGRFNLRKAMLCQGGPPPPPPPPPPGDAIVQFESAVYVADEGVGYAEVTLVRTGLDAISVGVYPTDGSATSPADYEAVSGTVSWNAGDGGPKVFRVFLQDDGYVEPTEWLQLNLIDPVGCVIGPQGTATLNINDNDVAATNQGSKPRNFFNLGTVTVPSYNYVWLFAATTADGEELWRSDGTSAGTYRVKDIQPGPGSSSPADFTFDWYQGGVLFTADDGVHGRELWVTDGTEAGTLLLFDIVPGPAGSSPAKFVRTSVGGFGRVFFTALTASGEELWATDGTSEGTYPVLDINPGPEGSLPSPVVPIQGAVLFAATDPVNGRELWRSDGTAAGTTLVRNIRNGVNSSNPDHLINAGSSGGSDVVYFSAAGGQGNELWKTDGTQAGTVQVKDIRPGGASSPQQLTVVAPNLIFFSAHDGTTGRELWRSDGTAAGTTLIRDINPGLTNSSPVRITPAYFGGAVFVANGGEGNELWKTDGTDAGTMMVKDIFPGTSASNPQQLTNIAPLTGQRLAFSATDGVTGREFWTSDGTEAGTTLFKDLRTGTGNSVPADFHFTLVNDREQVLFTAAGTGFGRELWRTDGTPAGTILIKNIR